ncbi:MAG: hypothetical protein LBN97_00650 [Oscillospiraceae bacterium]|jgi:hypothetical protein|nr:hypothetical protein [Oscillospiraceae bacterium]
MKKLLSLLLAAAMFFMIAACSKTGGGESTATPEATPEAAATPELATEAPQATETPAATPEAVPATEAPGSELSGATSEILDAILALTTGILVEAEAGASLPMTFNADISADNSQNMLGLDAEQFAEYVTDAVAATAAISTTPYEVALINCNDHDAALEVQKLVGAGFDSNKWICVIPDQSFTVSSGNYVLLGVTKNDEAGAIKDAFAELTGTRDNIIDVFFTKA